MHELLLVNDRIKRDRTDPSRAIARDQMFRQMEMMEP
jgi:hypothetical protein